MSRQGSQARRTTQPRHRRKRSAQARQSFLALCHDKDLRVTIGFPGILGGLGSNIGFLCRDKDFWPSVAT